MPADNPFLHIKARTFLLWALVSIGLGLGGYAVVASATELSFGGLDPLVSLLVFSGWLYGLILAWGIWSFRRHGADLRRLVGRLPSGYNWWPPVGLVAATLLFSVAAIWLVYYSLSFIAPGLVDSLAGQELYAGDEDTSSPIVYNLAILAMLVLVAPVLEEVLFRGILLTRWSVRWGTGRAILLSSGLFAILHPDPLGAFAFGVVASLLYLRTRTLIVPIACHFLHNAVVAAMAGLAMTADGGVEVGEPDAGADLVVAMVFLAVSAPILIRFITRGWALRGRSPPYFDPLPAATVY